MNFLSRVQTHRVPLLTKTQKAAIDGLRGALALLVFCFHFSMFYKPAFNTFFPTIGRMLELGWIAVPIFFCLSGFLVILSYQNLSITFRSQVNLRFFIRRMFRIWPAWLVVLCFQVLDGGGVSIATFLWNLFLLFGICAHQANDLLIPVSWSLFPEEMFYLSFPVVYEAIKRGLFWVLLGLSFFFSFLWQKQLLQVFGPEGAQFGNSLSTLACFFTGVGFYWIVPFLPRRGSRAAGVFIDVAIVLLVSIFVIYGLEIYGEILFVAVMFGVLYPRGLFRWILANLFRFFGTRCYSIYLTHTFAIRWGWLPIKDIPFGPDGSAFGTVIVFISTSIVMLGLAELLYRAVEKPAHELGRRLSESF